MSEYSKGHWVKENTPSILVKSMFYYIQSMGHFYCGPEYCVDRKDYNSILLLYTINGEGELKYFGQSYTLIPGTVFLIDCMNSHCYKTKSKEKPWEFIWIHFNGGESRSYIKYIHSNEGPVYSIQKDSIIPSSIYKIHKLYKSGNVSADIQSSCIIIEILTELMLRASPLNLQHDNCPDAIKKAIKYIEKHFSKPITVEDLAEKIGMSKYHFTRLFKKSTGYSPYEYLIVTRLNYSKELLKTTEYPVYEIAMKTGFDSASHYIKTFKQKEGNTPLVFRKYWR